MGTRKKFLSLLLMVVLLLPMGMGIHVEAADETKQVYVLFTHDTHSHLNSFSTIVDGEQKEVGGFAKIKRRKTIRTHLYWMAAIFQWER